MTLHNRITPERVHPLPKSVLLEDEQTVNPDRDNKDIPGDPPGSFQFGIWLLLVLEVWVLDFGRPIFGMFVMRSMPLSALSIGDYCHMAYNIITALCLYTLQERSLRPVPKVLQHLLMVLFVMGASIHLVGDAIQHRLVRSGYKLHIAFEENPIIKELHPKSLTPSFELLNWLDEDLGHIMWYIGLNLFYTLYFASCFGKKAKSELQLSVWALLLLSALHEWYFVTEGQVFLPFLLTLVSMLAVLLWRSYQGLRMDSNGRFLFLRVVLALLLVSLWVSYLWNDPVLRQKYPGWLYVPEPWAYASLYLLKS